MDGLAAASSGDVDVLLSTELGTIPTTKALQGGRYVSDWSCSDAPSPGKSVGAFFDLSLIHI
eukprot:11504244-Karenia_brevis.AAC.1